MKGAFYPNTIWVNYFIANYAEFCNSSFMKIIVQMIKKSSRKKVKIKNLEIFWYRGKYPLNILMNLNIYICTFKSIHKAYNFFSLNSRQVQIYT